MTFTLIAAVARNGVIGNGNAIPWHLPEDFKHFSKTTKHHVVIMGGNTWDSLPLAFRPLPQRVNIVISSRVRPAERSIQCKSIAEAIAAAERQAELLSSPEVFIIGGSSIYEQFLPMADKLILSEIAMEPEGDTFFPSFDRNEWVVSERDEREGFVIKTYKKG